MRVKFNAKMKKDLSELVTVTRAAEIIGVTPARVRQLIAGGELPALRLSMLVDPEDLALFADPPRRGGKPRTGRRREAV
jgi:hypothetical protein